MSRCVRSQIDGVNGLNVLNALENLMKLRNAFVLTLCLSPVPAMADGNELLSQCQTFADGMDSHKTLKPDDSFGGGYCMGIVKAVATLGPEMRPDMKSCIPNGVTKSQTVRVVIKWLKDHPSVLNHDATLLTTAALNDAYPCKDSK